MNEHVTQDAMARLLVIDQVAMSSLPTLCHSYLAARDVLHRGVPGCLVECGVYAGSQCGAMALAVQEARVDCRIHCFDSFCGFPKASVKDDADWQARLGVGSSQEPSKPLDPAWGFSTKQTVERVSENFRKWGFSPEMFVFHEGWFQDTIPGWREPIAVLRIDGDIYESTLVCLAELYPWLSDGGICILDDYNTVNGCRLACDEYFQNSVQPILVKDGGGPVWWIKGR